MNEFILLAIYSVLIFSASLLGGLLPSLLTMTHTRTQLMMSFVAGLMLGVACYHLLPHAILTINSEDAVNQVSWWMMVGLLLMFVLLRVFHFHQHDPGVVEGEHNHDSDQNQNKSQGHKHSHNHAHDHSNDNANDASPLSWLGIAFGLSLHTLIDGVALGAAIQADSVHQGQAGLFSVGVFVAIVLHKPLDAMSITALMTSSGWDAKVRRIVNIGFALMCPIGALLFFQGVSLFGGERDLFVGSALAFSAGVFLCISLSDLLPELQFHTHDRLKLTVALLAGVTLAYGIGFLEPERAHHNHSDEPAHDNTESVDRVHSQSKHGDH